MKQKPTVGTKVKTGNKRILQKKIINSQKTAKEEEGKKGTKNN